MIKLGNGGRPKISRIIENDGETGRLAEERVLYPCICDCSNCESDFDLVKKVIESQPTEPREWNPTDPKPPIANNIHASVAIALGLEDWSELKIYTALHTALDKRGVDCFLKLGNGLVMIDLTVNSQKDEHHADIIFNVNFGADKAELTSFGERVAEMFRSGGAREYNNSLVL